MSWSLIGAGTASKVASGNVSPGMPANTLEGDLLVYYISYRDSVAFTLPSGWTAGPEENTGNTQTNLSFAIPSGKMGYIIRGASAPALTATRTGGNAAVAQILAYRSTLTPVFSTSGSVTGTSNNTTIFLSGGITPSGTNPLLVIMHSGNRANTGTGKFDAAVDPSIASPSSQTLDTSTAPTSDTWINRTLESTTLGADCQLTTGDGLMTTARNTGTLQGGNTASTKECLLVMAFVESAGFETFDESATVACTAGFNNTPLLSLFRSLGLSQTQQVTPTSTKSLFTTVSAGNVVNVEDILTGFTQFGFVTVGNSNNVDLERFGVVGSSLQLAKNKLVDSFSDALAEASYSLAAQHVNNSLAASTANATTTPTVSLDLDVVSSVSLFALSLVSIISGLSSTSTFGPGVRVGISFQNTIAKSATALTSTEVQLLSTLVDLINGGKFFGEATPDISVSVDSTTDSTLEKIGRVTLTVSKDQSWVGSVLNASSTVGTVGVQPGLVYTPVADANVSINMSTQKGYVATAVLGYDLAVAVGVQVQYLHGEQASSIGKLLLPVTKVVTSSGSANQQSVSILGHTVSIINRFPLGTFPADPRRFIAIAQDASLLVLDDDGNLEYVAKDYEIILDGESFIINIK